ncbi:tetratricopeptide repeat protein [bacterium]|nr:tetratricopeptide repeat protein [bacterium]
MLGLTWACWRPSGGDAHDPDDADRPLEDLLDAGLLESSEAGGDRYQQHRLLHAYARALLAEAGELEDAQQRHFTYLSAHYADFDRNNDEDTHPAIQRDFDNIRAALDWGLKNAPEATCDWTIALDYYMQMRESLTLRQDRLQQAKAAADGIGYSRGQANTLQALGDLRLRQADLAGAEAAYQQALPLFETIGARLGQANTLMSLGDMHISQKRWQAAAGYYAKALPIARAIQARLGIANILYDYGLAQFELGDHNAGIDALKECLSIFEAIQSPRWAANARRRLNELLQRAGRSGEVPGAPSVDQNEQMQQAMRALLQVYQQQGADAVREMLKGQVPAEAIEGLLAQLASAAAQSGAPNTLPAETVNQLAGNTVAVRTQVPDKLDEWRTGLQGIRNDFASKGENWAIEVAFADALLSILAGGTPTLPPDNPYAGVIEEVKDGIASYTEGA